MKIDQQLALVVLCSDVFEGVDLGRNDVGILTDGVEFCSDVFEGVELGRNDVGILTDGVEF